MKRKALVKDFFMEIKSSYNRFLSIFLIVALGVAFFAGIRATNPDMRITADAYYDDSRLMDIRVLGSLGLNNDDVTAISKVTGVEAAEPAYSTHVVCNANGSEFVVEVMSATKKLNLIKVTEGRMPENTNEVLVEPKFLTSSGYKIGDTITLTSGTDEDIGSILKNDEFTIVGTGTTAYYLSFQRGSSNIGSGDVDSFIVISPEAFALPVYTSVYIGVKDARNLTSYTDPYDKKVAEVVTNVKAIADQQNKKRYNEIYQEASDKIGKAKVDLVKAKAEAAQQLQKGLAQLQLVPMDTATLQAAKDKLEATKKEADQKFQDAEDKIKASEADLAKLKVPKWYVLDRSSIDAYVEYEQNADRIGAIGEVFPAIFFLVAALISLTTMTRMVEEERTQIGILKALGYSKKSIAAKYLIYAILATLGGSIAGALVGLKVLPTVIITAYKMLYRNLPGVSTPFNTYYSVLATVLAVFTVGIATFIACYRELLAKPAELMRPVAPKVGKRVIMERIPFIWNRLSFTWKATIRNLMRYKKRFFMTVFGIGGCMALLLVGFGLRDSIFVIYTRQFDEIMLYDATVGTKAEATLEEKTALEDDIERNNKVSECLTARERSVTVKFGKAEEDLSIVVPEDTNRIGDFIVLRNRVKHTPYKLNDEGIIITEQIAKKLGVKPGDTIEINEEDSKATVKVIAITENYMSHYIYMTPELYKKSFRKDPDYNTIFVQMTKTDTEHETQLGEEILSHPAASGIFYTSYFRSLLQNILTSLNIVVWVLIISAGALAFVVLYNLNNININERRRELATIKVLGFYNGELAEYVYRENIILTIIGAILGIGFGILLHRYVITTVEIEMVMFGRNINISSYLYSVLLTIFFSAFVNFVMYFKLKKINMVESLKSVE